MWNCRSLALTAGLTHPARRANHRDVSERSTYQSRPNAPFVTIANIRASVMNAPNVAVADAWDMHCPTERDEEFARIRRGEGRMGA